MDVLLLSVKSKRGDTGPGLITAKSFYIIVSTIDFVGNYVSVLKGIKQRHIV
jgi:hypothetical protein